MPTPKGAAFLTLCPKATATNLSRWSWLDMQRFLLPPQVTIVVGPPAVLEVLIRRLEREAMARCGESPSSRKRLLLSVGARVLGCLWTPVTSSMKWYLLPMRALMMPRGARCFWLCRTSCPRLERGCEQYLPFLCVVFENAFVWYFVLCLIGGSAMCADVVPLHVFRAS